MISRRRLIHTASMAGLMAGFPSLVPAWARQVEGLSPSSVAGNRRSFDLAIGKTDLPIGDKTAAAKTINGTIPGPLLRFREGESVRLRVRNDMDEDTSIHWHGILLPAAMDGVPDVSFPGIKPGETFVYEYQMKQSGTYWYHSHSGLQEQSGVFGPMIIDPVKHDPVKYDREHLVVLSDWTFEDPDRVYAKLKKQSDYYNYQKRTVGDFFRDVSKNGFGSTISDRLSWGRMRMDPTDIADITGATYTYLMNGQAPLSNWNALFQPGEKVRLRFINAAAMSYFNVRIPGLPLTIVQADGQNVQPVTVDEFQMGVAETYDVIVEPTEDRAYTIFAESMDRSGYARGTLAPREGLSADIPKLRAPPLLTMTDMGMDHGGGTDHGSMKDAGEMSGTSGHGSHSQMMDHSGHTMSGMSDQMQMDNSGNHSGHSKTVATKPMKMNHDGNAEHGAAMPVPVTYATTGDVPPDLKRAGVDAIAEMPKSRLHEPGTGLENVGHRVLAYTDLRNTHGRYDPRPPGREIILHLTGNMERYMWSFDGKKYTEVTGPLAFRHGERLRMTMINNTMMNHPIHLHGMWMELDNGAGDHKPRKHTINIKPGEKLSVEITADALGDWAFHCHLLYHMKAGMFRVVSVAHHHAETKG